ncbi:MAG: methyl-accepting chemotaxis protein [Acidobacteria bacterium]|nr:methyl-accepting chemotaxis protein [Acidobacteriota bacterium]MDW7983247.1 methyl-accepting chemotaxis protein [Acidobacteriota bacterium]
MKLDLPHFHSLRVRFLMVGVAPMLWLLLGLVILSGFSLNRLYHLHERGTRNLAQQIARDIAYYVRLRLEDPLNEVLDRAIQTNSVARAEVYGSDGQVLSIRSNEVLHQDLNPSAYPEVQQALREGQERALLRTSQERYIVYQVPIQARGTPLTEAAILGGAGVLKAEGATQQVVGRLVVYMPLREYEHARRSLLWLSVILITGFAFISVLQGQRLMKSIRKRVLAVIEGATTVAEGRLSYTVPASGRDELATLGSAFNQMVERFRHLIRQAHGMADSLKGMADHLRQGVRRVQDLSQSANLSFDTIDAAIEQAVRQIDEIHQSLADLSASSQETSSSVLEMNATAEEMNHQVERLTQQIETATSAVQEMVSFIREVDANVERLFNLIVETTASLEQMGASITQIARSGQESLTLANAVTHNAREGIQSMESMLQVMNDIQAAIQEAWQVVNQLEKRSGEIAMITGVIEDIADQTNLLALNAAIIAAQAGEYGRSFAVVAEEIRNLANRTASSTGEINKLIGHTQNDITMTVQSIQQGRQRVQEGVRLATTTHQALQQIYDSAQMSRSKAQEIARATEEQTRSIQMVNQVMEQIHQLGQQVARASQNLRVGSTQIQETMEQMRDMSDIARRATAEQLRGTRLIAQSVEITNNKIGTIADSADDIRQKAHEIRESARRFKEVSLFSQPEIQQLEQLTETLQSHAEALHVQMGYFTL